MGKKIFIVGVGRSGTTLLQSILNAHSDIFLPPESHFIKNYVVPELKGKKYQKKNILELLKDLLNDDNLKGYAIENYINDKTEISTDKYISPQVYQLLFEKQGIKYLGDKDPMNIVFLEYIHQAFPDSKVIHIIRDPKDVIASRVKSSWGKKNSAIWHASEYKFSINKGMQEGEEVFGNHYLEIKYESLISKPEETIRKMCDFLKVEFEEGMLSHHLKADEIVKEHEIDWKKKVFSPIDESSIGKWKESLTDRQVKEIESILSKEINSLGYQTNSKPSFLQKIKSGLYSTVVISLFKFRFG